MATESTVARDQYENYRFCYDNGHEDWLQVARMCFDFFRGKQWDDRDLAKLKREGRPALTFNVVESLVRAMKGIQRALRNDVRFMPVHSDSVESARIHDALWLHVQNQNQLDFLEGEVWEKGMIMGRAYYDVRVSYDESFQGHIRIRTERSQDVVLDPSADTYDPDEWPQVIKRRWVSYNDILHLFGKEKADAIGMNRAPGWMDYEDIFMSQRMGQLPYYRYETIADPSMVRGLLLLDRQYKVVKLKDVFVDVETGDVSEIPETWDRNRIASVLQATPGLNTIRRKVKTVRWTVSCEDVVLHNEDSPYKHYTVVPFFPTFVDGVSMGAVESLLDSQRLFNKITSSELHILSTTANSGYKVKKGSLQNMSIQELEERGASTGFVAELADVADLEKIQPNNIPQGHDRLSFKADQIMRQLVGVSNQARGFAREDVAGEAIMANQAAQEINLAGWLSNLHRTKQLLALRAMDCWKAHYTETRAIVINRGSALNPSTDVVTINQPSPEGKVINDVTRGQYLTTLVPAPSRSTMSEEDFKLLISLRKDLGIAVPDAMLIELSPAANKAQIIQMLQGDSNERQRAAEEAAAQEQAAKIQTETAKAEKERTAAALNQARAEKFMVEAQVDPDAAYERTEARRMAVEQQVHQDNLAVKREELALKRKDQQDQVALRLAELDQQREAAKEKAAADKAAAKSKPANNRPQAKK